MASVTLPFLLRRLQRRGASRAAAPRPRCRGIPPRSPATPRSPGSATRPSSCAWTASTFITDPIFSHRCSPLSVRRAAAAGAARASRSTRSRGWTSRCSPTTTTTTPTAPASQRPGRPRRALRRAARDGRAGAGLRRAGPGARLVGVARRSAGVRVALRARAALLGTRAHRPQPAAVGGLGGGGPTRRFYHAGDTGYFGGFAEIGERFGPIDLAAMPIGAYLPREMMRLRAREPGGGGARGGGPRRAARARPCTSGRSTSRTSRWTSRRGASAPRPRAQGLDEDRAWVLKVGETRQW